MLGESTIFYKETNLMPSRFRHSWTCPACQFEHTWSWPHYDKVLVGEKVWMDCENCKASTPMRWLGTGGWVEVDPDSLNILTAKEAKAELQ